MTDLQDPDRSRRASPQMVLWLAVGLLILALALYAMLGHPEILFGQAPSQAQEPPDVERMVEALAKKLKGEPDNPRGWVMLARSYKVMGRTQEAEQAFAHAGHFIDNDAHLLAMYADLMVSNAGGDFSGKPSELIEQALKLDAHNVLALWLAGSSEFQKSRYRSALRYWEQAQSQLSLESENAPILQQAIAEARARLASPKNKSP